MAKPILPEIWVNNGRPSSRQVSSEQHILGRIRDLERRVEWDIFPRVEFKLEEANQEYGVLFLRFFDMKKAEEQRHSAGSQPSTTGDTVAHITNC